MWKECKNSVGEIEAVNLEYAASIKPLMNEVANTNGCYYVYEIKMADGREFRTKETFHSQAEAELRLSVLLSKINAVKYYNQKD